MFSPDSLHDTLMELKDDFDIKKEVTSLKIGEVTPAEYNALESKIRSFKRYINEITYDCATVDVQRVARRNLTQNYDSSESYTDYQMIEVYLIWTGPL